MSTLDISAFLTLAAGLSVATQKLVDIIKAWIPALNAPDPGAGNAPTPASEASRQRWVQFTAGIAGIITACASWPAIKDTEFGKSFVGLSDTEQALAMIVLGLLASGGSGPWNDLSTWIKNLKDASKPSKPEDS